MRKAENIEECAERKSLCSSVPHSHSWHGWCEIEFRSAVVWWGLRERDCSGTVTGMLLWLWGEVGSTAEISVSCLCPGHCWLLALGLHQPPHLMWFQGAKNSCLRSCGQIGQIFVSCKFREMTTTILEKKWAGDFVFVYFAPFCRSFSGCLKAMLPSGSLGLWNIWLWRTPERELYMKSFLKA